MEKVKACSGTMLGKTDMDKYPISISLGLLLLSISIWNYNRKYRIPEFDV